MDDKGTDAWSSGFTEIVAQAVSEFHEGTILDEEKLAALAMKLSKLTKAQESWKKHFLNDHQPDRELFCVQSCPSHCLPASPAISSKYVYSGNRLGGSLQPERKGQGPRRLQVLDDCRVQMS